MGIYEKREIKWLIDKPKGLFLTRRSGTLRRAGGLLKISMNTIILLKRIMLFFLILAFSCKKTSNEVILKSLQQQNAHQEKLLISSSKKYYESVDTAEFVIYWKQFRKAVLEHNTATLSLMINDSINKDGFLIGKTGFLENLYNLFTPEYMLLLETYNVDKYLFPKGNNRRCWITKKDVTYESGLDFKYIQSNERNFYRIANYYMSKFKNHNYFENDSTSADNEQLMGYRKQDLDSKYPIIYNFNFTHTPTGIKLYEVSVSNIVSISD